MKGAHPIPALAWISTRARLTAVFSHWLMALLCGALVAAPLGLAFSELAGNFPTGDSALFTPGATLLIELLRVRPEALTISLQISVLLFVVASGARLLTLSGVVVTLGHSIDRSESALTRSVRALPRILSLSGSALVLRGLAIGVLLLSVGWVSSVFEHVTSERTLDLLLLATAVVCLFPLAILQVILDLARAVAGREGASTWSAARVGMGRLRQRPVYWTTRWLLLGALGWLGPALSWLVIDALPSTPGTGAALLLHQAAATWLFTSRICWLSLCGAPERQLDIEQPGPPDAKPAPLDDKAERTFERDAPTPSLGASPDV